jgi:hypothetical protein
LQHSIFFDGVVTHGDGGKHVFTFGGGKIIVGRSLTDEEWLSYRDAAALLYSFGAGVDLLNDSVANYNEFVEPFNALQGIETDDAQSDARGRDLARQINRRLLNYLSSTRLFLDYSESRLKRTYGKTSDEVVVFKELCKMIFDTDFSYRFAYKLRNYTQHFGLPITRAERTGKLESSPDSASIFTTRIAFNVPELLSRGKDVWGPVRKDLQASPPDLDVASVLRGVPATLALIMRGLLRIEGEHLLDAARVVRETLRTEGHRLRSSVVGEWQDRDDKTGVTYDDPPLRVLDYLARNLEAPATPV